MENDKSVSRVIETKVHFKRLSEKEIDDYVASGEPLDKAGAYAIQGSGSRFIERIEGGFSNVVGLPVEAVIEVLKEFGIGPENHPV